MANVVSASLMVDAASDIQMSKHLNMFVNVLLETGEVKTLTLSLAGRWRESSYTYTPCLLGGTFLDTFGGGGGGEAWFIQPAFRHTV
jgi:hypothetical protein